MKEIGGFFNLELCKSKEYHFLANKLNSGRNALRYSLRNERPELIYVPHYICNSLLETLMKEKIKFKFYHINDHFEPENSEVLQKSNCYILYVNYFGINDTIVQILSSRHVKLIIDNSQAFFSKPIKGLITFYSPRKFFGVADGGYVYTDKLSGTEKINRDISYNRYKYLLKRSDIDAESSYKMYIKNETSFSRRPVRLMSKLTENILSSIDYKQAKISRENNFSALHEKLATINELPISTMALNGPMIYPFLLQENGLRDFLLKNKIYVARYWQEVMKRVNKNTVEYKFAKYLIPLPIDQRYEVADMGFVADTVLGFVKRESRKKRSRFDPI